MGFAPVHEMGFAPVHEMGYGTGDIFGRIGHVLSDVVQAPIRIAEAPFKEGARIVGDAFGPDGSHHDPQEWQRYAAMRGWNRGFQDAYPPPPLPQWDHRHHRRWG